MRLFSHFAFILQRPPEFSLACALCTAMRSYSKSEFTAFLPRRLPSSPTSIILHSFFSHHPINCSAYMFTSSAETYLYTRTKYNCSTAMVPHNNMQHYVAIQSQSFCAFVVFRSLPNAYYVNKRMYPLCTMCKHHSYIYSFSFNCRSPKCCSHSQVRNEMILR